jgi:hypothetical protein
MKLISWILFFAAALSLINVSCADHTLPPLVECLSDETISFDEDVNPIVVNVCAVPGCHNGSNGADRNWLVFSNFQDHRAEVRRRILLPSEHPDHMPRVGSLTADQIQTIVCWVDQGGQDN